MQTPITYFRNPFSFFCASETEGDENVIRELELLYSSSMSSKAIALTNLEHGQYIAVYWIDKWVRGIVSLENQILIWLVDYGLYLRPQEKTHCVPLSYELKKMPSKIFEASIHGGMPVDKQMDDECELIDVPSTTWNPGATAKCKQVIATAIKTIFVPVALLSTKHNDIVLGDLYVDLPRKGLVNIIDELQQWPVFLEKNAEHYIKNLQTLYTSRRRHHACPLKPNIANLTPLTLFSTVQEYNNVLATAVQPEYNKECVTLLQDGSTVIGENGKDVKPYEDSCALTPEELEQYANMNVRVCGKEYNMLNLLVNKAKDFDICKRYEDHDLKGFGRGCSYSNLIF